MSNGLRPAWLISYENKDISLDIADMVTSVTYTDHVKGKTDELELAVHDVDAMWRSGWYPSLGDRFDVKIGFEGQPLIACGRFSVDTVDLDSPPDVVTIRGLAAGNASPIRSQRSQAFEGLSLDGIAQKVAGEYGYQVEGDLAGLPIMKRVSQADESDLSFLARVAETYGFAFSLRGEQLCFYSIETLEQAPAITTIDRGDLKSYRFSDKAQNSYVACEVTFHDPESGQVMKARVEADNLRPRGSGADSSVTLPSSMISLGSKGDQVREWQRWILGQVCYAGAVSGIYDEATDRGTRAFQRTNACKVDGIVGPETYGAAVGLGFVPVAGVSAKGGAGGSGDVLRKTLRCESMADAEAKARAALAAANRLKVKGSIEVAGNQFLVAGAKLELTGMMRLSGQYTIDTSRHAMTKSGGYSTSLEVAYV